MPDTRYYDPPSKVRWEKDNTKRISLKLNKHTDADILSHLDALPNVQGYIKQLIREDIAKSAQQSPTE